MINYSISLRANPSDQDAPKKAYANAQYSEIMTLDKFAEHISTPRLQIQPCRHPGGPDPSGGLYAGAASGRTTHPDGRSGHFLHSYQQHGSRITGNIQSRHPCGRLNVRWKAGTRFLSLLKDSVFNLVPTRKAAKLVVKALKAGKNTVDLTGEASGPDDKTEENA